MPYTALHHAVPPCAVPPYAVTPYAVPPYAVPPYTVPPYAVPPYTVPPYAVPWYAVSPYAQPPHTVSYAMPPDAIPFAMSPHAAPYAVPQPATAYAVQQTQESASGRGVAAAAALGGIPGSSHALGPPTAASPRPAAQVHGRGRHFSVPDAVAQGLLGDVVRSAGAALPDPRTLARQAFGNLDGGARAAVYRAHSATYFTADLRELAAAFAGHCLGRATFFDELRAARRDGARAQRPTSRMHGAQSGVALSGAASADETEGVFPVRRGAESSRELVEAAEYQDYDDECGGRAAVVELAIADAKRIDQIRARRANGPAIAGLGMCRCDSA